MQTLDVAQYDLWRRDADVLEQDEHGVKVLRLADGTFLKLFRRKRWLSKNTFYPPAKRFAANAAKLEQLAIPCPRILQLYRLSEPYRSVVHYDPLPGSTIRDLLTAQPDLDQLALFSRLVEFITHLHEIGVYFRSLHLGNIVLTPDDEFGLIDISDLRCLGKPLSHWMRNRNYQHLRRHGSDWDLVQPEVDTLIGFNQR